MKILPNFLTVERAIEQTSLYTVVYRTFLYNPTNQKVPKKAMCIVKLKTPTYATMISCHHWIYLSRVANNTMLISRIHGISSIQSTKANSMSTIYQFTALIIWFAMRHPSSKVKLVAITCWTRYSLHVLSPEKGLADSLGVNIASLPPPVDILVIYFAPHGNLTN